MNHLAIFYVQGRTSHTSSLLVPGFPQLYDLTEARASFHSLGKDESTWCTRVGLSAMRRPQAMLLCVCANL